jgi:hypothetical protein
LQTYRISGRSAKSDRQTADSGIIIESPSIPSFDTLRFLLFKISKVKISLCPHPRPPRLGVSIIFFSIQKSKIVNRQSSIVSRQSSVVSRQSSVVNRQSSVVNQSSLPSAPLPVFQFRCAAGVSVFQQ